MREYKFRAWHEGYDLGKGRQEPQMLQETYPGEVFAWLHLRQPIKIMQFTGLCDRNGRDGYEGDIIKRQYMGDTDYGLIEFGNGCFRVKWRKDIFSETLLYHLPEAEIVGNIYENPELLEVSQ